MEIIIIIIIIIIMQPKISYALLQHAVNFCSFVDKLQSGKQVAKINAR